MTDEAATVRVTVEVRNAADADAEVRVAHRVLAPDGEEVASCATTLEVARWADAVAEQDLTVPRPRRWSPETPEPVHLYTNCDEAERFLNGTSLGRRARPGTDELYLSWNVPYAPGRLEAHAFRDGREATTAVVHTAGPAVRIRLEPEREAIAADGRDLVYVRATVVDAEDVMVPKGAHTITFGLDGPGELLATDHGDPVCHIPFSAPRRPAFNGIAMAIVRSTETPGILVLTAAADGLASGEARVQAG
ncbi:MAG: DUF4982 domain-containing protein [Planctomycetota bacterium]